mgnify:CR=1 FL=1
MKATGIVRRIEEYGIIGQNCRIRTNIGFIAIFNGTQFAHNIINI